MNKKICIGKYSCGLEKDIDEFYYYKKRNYYFSICKECYSKKSKNYYQNNRKKILKHQNNYNKNNRKLRKNYYQNNREKILKQKKEYYLKIIYGSKDYITFRYEFDSKAEEWFYNEIIIFYPNIKYQYKLNKYYYDFYISEINTIIELQLFWMHGFIIYDENNYNHQHILNIWKSKNTEQYNRAIKIWTFEDPRKRQICYQSNINLIELFTKQQCEEYLNML